MAETLVPLAADATEHHNRSTHAYVRLLGTAIGLAATAHGAFEVRQGNRTTCGHILADIGAFTLIPNYRATGIATIATGLTLSGWTLARMRSRSGPPVFLLLSTLSFLLGGGIAQLPASLLTWGVAGRIGGSLYALRSLVDPGLRSCPAPGRCALRVCERHRDEDHRLERCGTLGHASGAAYSPGKRPGVASRQGRPAASGQDEAAGPADPWLRGISSPVSSGILSLS